MSNRNARTDAMVFGIYPPSGKAVSAWSSGGIRLGFGAYAGARGEHCSDPDVPVKTMTAEIAQKVGDR
jgi:hypothetical protein